MFRGGGPKKFSRNISPSPPLTKCLVARLKKEVWIKFLDQIYIYTSFLAMPFFQRYSLKLCLIKYALDTYAFVYLNCSFSIVGTPQTWLTHLLLLRNNYKHFVKGTVQQFWSDQGFMGTVVIRAVLSLHGMVTFPWWNKERSCWATHYRFHYFSSVLRIKSWITVQSSNKWLKLNRF